MKYILRGNDIPVTWNLKDYSTWEPISVPQSASSFYVYSNDLRVKIDDFTITDSVLTSTIAGNLLPSGKYTLELIWNNNGWGRTIAIGVFSVTDGGENADRIDTDSTISLWELLAAATSEQINISHLKDALKNYSTGSGGTSSGDSDILDIVLRKDKDDLTPHNLTIGKLLKASNLEATSSAKTPYLTVSVLAKIAKIFVDIIGTEKFVDGFLGEGWQIWKAIASGDWNFTIDRMTIRKTLTVFEMIIQKIRAVGGALIVSAADGKIKTVEESGDNYAITFEDDNMFIEHDLARMQVYSGAGNTNVIRYYWVEVGAVEGSTIYVPKSEFEGVPPLVGDEWVLMGNTTNTLRQNLIYISATEDGQPRIEVLENVKTKNLIGCMTVRLGNLDGITDSNFPTDAQPSGDGLYGNNVFLRGRFVLSNNGKDISTLFEVLEDKIAAHLTATRTQMNENILYNSSFVENTDGWTCDDDVRIMTYGGKFFMPNGVLYTFKNKVVEISEINNLNVVKILGGGIRQLNSKFQNMPIFNSLIEVSKDEEGNIITDSNGVPVDIIKRYAKNFTLSFYYKCDTAGTMNVEMTDCTQGDFEAFDILNESIPIAINEDFIKKTITFKWNGTGNFKLSFSGLIYLYDLQINWSDAIDLRTELDSTFEYTAEHFQVSFSKIKHNAENIETYKSSFELSAEQMKAEYTKMVGDLQTDYSAFKISAEQTLSTHAQNISDAQSAADQAADVADSAMSKATDSYNKATANATAILQTQDYISLISANFNADGGINTTGLVTVNGNFSTLFAQYMGSEGLVTSADLDVYVKKDSSGRIISGISLSADQLDFNADSIRISASHIEFIGKTFYGTHISFDALGNLTFEQGAKSTWYNTNQSTETDNYVQIQGSNASGLIYSKSTYSNYTAAYFVNTNSGGTALKAEGNVLLGIGVSYSRVKIQGLNMPTFALTSSGPSYGSSKVWMCNVSNDSSFNINNFPNPQDGDTLLIRKCASGNLTITGDIYNGWDGTTENVTLTNGSLGVFMYSTKIGTGNHSGWVSNYAPKF